MTQQQLGDVKRLASVDVERTLMGLETEGLIERRNRSVVIGDWQDPARVADQPGIFAPLAELSGIP
jgi:hypothetical protein